jgi:hypothetical protein
VGLGITGGVLGGVLTVSGVAAGLGLAAIYQQDQRTRLDATHHAIPFELALLGDALAVWVGLAVVLLTIPLLVVGVGLLAAGAGVVMKLMSAGGQP